MEDSHPTEPRFFAASHINIAVQTPFARPSSAEHCYYFVYAFVCVNTIDVSVWYGTKCMCALMFSWHMWVWWFQQTYLLAQKYVKPIESSKMSTWQRYGRLLNVYLYFVQNNNH